MKALYLQQREQIPSRSPLEYKPASASNNHHLVTNSTFQTDSFISLTENQIFSHEIIKNVMFQNQNKLVNHQISQISPNTVLNAEPRTKMKQQFNFQSIPPKNRLYQSLFSTKIRQISDKFVTKGNSRPNRSEIIKIPEYNYLSNKKNKISVSGLVTYNFKSRNACRSIGYNQINYEQQLQNDKKNAHKTAKCKSLQNKKIIQNFSAKRYERFIENDELIMKNEQKTTDTYLKNLMRQKKQNQLIYIEKAKKINYIKQIMAQVDNNYDDAQLIIDKIQRANQKQRKKSKKASIKTQIDEEYELQQRRIPQKKKKILIRYVTFVD